MKSDETLGQVLRCLSDCSVRATTAAAIAKRVSATPNCESCSAAEVEDVIGVLDQLPYVQVLRKASGRLAGLRFEAGKEGSCSLWYARVSPGYTQFFHGTVLAATVYDRDDFERHRAAQAAMESFAAERHLPVLDFLTRNLCEAILPFVKEALAKR